MGRTEVARELVAYGRELERAAAAQVGGSFTGIQAADALLESDPNAFLLGVLFTQGIPAERAWQGPYLLRERLGTLDPDYLSAHQDLVLRAIQTPPMLHRFKETLPRWVTAACARLVEIYDGDAANIWPSGTHTLTVAERLVQFDGIGRKKAAMAVEILSRHFGIALEGRECGQVAFDVQVRRVFLRTGLVDEDSRTAVEAVATEICPDSPGTLDLPAWLIGREVCRPRAPLCEQCRLAEACPRRTWLTPLGVGVRRSASS